MFNFKKKKPIPILKIDLQPKPKYFHVCVVCYYKGDNHGVFGDLTMKINYPAIYPNAKEIEDLTKAKTNCESVIISNIFEMTQKQFDDFYK